MSKRPSTKKPARPKQPKPWWKRMRWRRIVLLGFGVLVLPFVGYVTVLYVFGEIPEPTEIASSESVIVVDQKGRSVGRIHGGADRISVALKDMPKMLQNAVIATEDRRFYRHPGVSIPSIFRAAFSNALGRGRQGGSTITQQYVKNAYVGNERSLNRKVKEAVIALKLERQRSKEAILELYINTVYLGRGAYGCEAASRTYFAKPCKQLSLAESALLAGMIKSPEELDPVRDPEDAKARRDLVFDLMVREKYLTEAQAARAKKVPVRARSRTVTGIAPHFVEDLRGQLEKQFGARDLYSGRITRVISTLDLEMQRAAREAVAKVYPAGTGVIGSGPGKGRRVEAALISLDPHTGQVRALIGERDFNKMQLDLATRARRQPGSTFKPVVLAEWLDDGRSVRDRFDGSSPKKVADQEINNYGNEDFGSITVEEATWRSVNTVYAQMIVELGATQAVEMARDLGARSKLVPQIGLTLGDQEVTPLELATMYSTLAARGMERQPTMFTRVIDREGKTIYQERPRSEDSVDRDVADGVNEVLAGVIENGTGRPADIGRPAAGKTGTTQDAVDAWFAGYTPELVTVVWNGVPKAFLPLRDVRGRIDGSERKYSTLFGGSFPAAIWRAYMSEAVKGLPATPFPDAKLVEPSATATPSSPSPTPSLPTKPPPSTPPLPSPTPEKTTKKSPSPKPTPTPTPTPTANEG